MEGLITGKENVPIEATCIAELTKKKNILHLLVFN